MSKSRTPPKEDFFHLLFIRPVFDELIIIYDCYSLGYIVLVVMLMLFVSEPTLIRLTSLVPVLEFSLNMFFLILKMDSSPPVSSPACILLIISNDSLITMSFLRASRWLFLRKNYPFLFLFLYLVEPPLFMFLYGLLSDGVAAAAAVGSRCRDSCEPKGLSCQQSDFVLDCLIFVTLSILCSLK